MLNVVVTLSSDPPPLLSTSHSELVLPKFYNKVKQLILTSVLTSWPQPPPPLNVTKCTKFSLEMPLMSFFDS